jgi:signal transduction histidine kinase
MRRLFTWLLLAIVAVVLVGTLTRTVFLSFSLRQSYQGETARAAMSDAGTIAAWAEERWDRTPDVMRPSLAALATVAGARVWLVDLTGAVLVDTEGNPSWEGSRLPPADFSRFMQASGRVVRGSSPWLETAAATVAPVTRKADGVVLGAVFLFVPDTPSGSQGSFVGPLFWSAVAGLAVTILGASLVSRKVSRPVEELTRFARTLGTGDFTGQVAVQSVTEVNDLATTLTQVGSRLKTSFDALSEERHRLATVLESMHDGVLVVDASSHLILLNEAAVQLLQWPAAPALPAPLNGPGLPNRLREALTAALRGERAEVYLRPQGQGDLMAVCYPVPSPGRGTGAVAVLHDVGAMLRLQRVRENFVADVAHELRGPLANLSVLAQALGDGTIDWEERTPFIQSLQDEIARLNRLSRDVLDLARMDAGVLAVSVEPVCLASIASSVQLRLAGRVAAAGVSLAVQVPPDLRPVAAPDRLEQVLYNLVENAIRHSRAGGSVTVAADRADGRIRLTVADKGYGIPADHLPHIFERFYKVDPSRTRSDAGMGLGLAVVKQLVELQGGTVEVASEINQGSIFSVLLLEA